MLFAEENELGGGVRDWLCHKLALWPWHRPLTPAFATLHKAVGLRDVKAFPAPSSL